VALFVLTELVLVVEQLSWLLNVVENANVLVVNINPLTVTTTTWRIALITNTLSTIPTSLQLVYVFNDIVHLP